MCTYSMVMDWGQEKLYPQTPVIPRLPPITMPGTTYPTLTGPPIAPTEVVPSVEWRKQFLNDLLDLLAKAKKYDEANGEPNCELDSKKEKLKAIADELGVEITFP